MGDLQKVIQDIKRRDLHRVALLGCGGFGAVTMEQQDWPSGPVFAMKAVSKGYVLKMEMEESIMSEKTILTMIDSPFIVKCYATFNGPEHLYFLMEVCRGGE